jgi:mannobiose 2-epimerase
LCEYSRTGGRIPGGRIPGGRIPGGRIPGGRIPGGASAFETALGLFALLERYALDRENGGYFEALSQNWKPTDDRKLSPVDLDCEKSMNTNLHVLEAYTNLLRTGMFLYPPGTGAGDRSHARVAAALEAQVHIMEERVLQPDGHLGLFFSGDWSRLDGRVSFGHDIEASWLLCEARDVLRRYAQRSGGAVTLPAASEPALRLATVTLEEGYDPERGGVYDERDGDEIDPCRIWWVQAESMVGFLNAYQLTGKEEFIEALSRTWEFVSVHMLDRDGGEWHWGVTDTGAVLDAYPKGGNWKTGYHNARACMEIIRRTEEVLRHEDA